MQIISRAITGESGLGPAFAFLAAGAIAVSFAFSAGIYLASKSSGASTTSIGLLLFGPLVAGAVHSLASAFAIRRASATKPRSTRVFALLVAGVYCFVQFSALAGGALLVFRFGL